MAFEPFNPADLTTEDVEYELLPCPARVPHDLLIGQRVARRGLALRTTPVGSSGSQDHGRQQAQDRPRQCLRRVRR